MPSLPNVIPLYTFIIENLNYERKVGKMSTEINLPGNQINLSPSTGVSANKKKIVNNYFDGLPVKGRHLFLFIILILSYFFEQLDNNNFAFIAPALMQSWGLEQAQIAQITSLYFMGMTLGGLTGGFVSDMIGRRKSFLFAMILFSSMSVLNGWTSNFTVFMISRALTGFGIFFMMVVSVAYISEMSPAESRGKWQNLTAAGGFCAMPAIGFIARAIIPTSPEAWRYVFYLGGIGFVGVILGFLFLKESPRWLVSKGRVNEAEEIVEELSGVSVDLSEVAKRVQTKEKFAVVLASMFGAKYIRRTLVLLSMFVLVNIGGFVTAVWIPTLMTMKGFSIEQSMQIGIAFMIGGPIGLFLFSFIADKGGRKWPIAISIFVSAALMLFFANLGTNIAVIMVTVLVMNAVGMGSGFMNMAYVAESYPTRMRNTATGIVNAAARFAVSGSQLLIPVVVAAYGVGGLFMSIASLNVIAAVIVMIWGASTGGKSLEDIA